MLARQWVGLSRGTSQTRALGRRIGRRAWPGLVIALHGPLGAGKTAFVQGLAQGVGVDASHAVCSPTYTLINPYPGRLMLQHLDFYRLEDPDELDVLGWDELLREGNVVVAEWAERFPEAFPDDHLSIDITFRSPRTRVIRLCSSSGSPFMGALFDALDRDPPLSPCEWRGTCGGHSSAREPR